VHPRVTRQRWTTAPALAEHLGMGQEAIRRWLRRGVLRAARPLDHHYSDDRKRATTRGGQWRIYEDDVMELLTHLRSGRTIRSFGPGFWKR
jgi:hypothetical protein